MRLDDKKALVVGASSGIGREVAREFVLQGADVTVLADEEAIFEVADCLGQETGRVIKALRCDITDRDLLRANLAAIDCLDILVHNAGFERLTPLGDFKSEDLFRRIIDVNLLGAYYVTNELAGRLRDGGRVIYTASTYSKYAIARMAAYASSKHALVGMLRSFSHEFGGRRITVNAVCPGWVNTEFSNRSVRQIALDTGRSVEDVGNEVLRLQAMTGHLEPREVVGGFLFLASDLAKDITGQTIHVDRGEYQD
ncbi:SDR family oxidoreductase [Mesorhizobium sp. KR9-304]|uniref:SDR family NAD(P)-dependent oxidoreductase n=1 Tax=Mesorhizobium sp. KR9-304 TaxID=3156614 RepID=UPI0032B528C5